LNNVKAKWKYFYNFTPFMITNQLYGHTNSFFVELSWAVTMKRIIIQVEANSCPLSICKKLFWYFGDLLVFWNIYLIPLIIFKGVEWDMGVSKSMSKKRYWTTFIFVRDHFKCFLTAIYAGGHYYWPWTNAYFCSKPIYCVLSTQKCWTVI
jgi:hypothetical protein